VSLGRALEGSCGREGSGPCGCGVTLLFVFDVRMFGSAAGHLRPAEAKAGA